MSCAELAQRAASIGTVVSKWARDLLDTPDAAVGPEAVERFCGDVEARLQFIREKGGV